ncbi:MAG: ABC transporter ATP-binding protein [Desulfocapsaceae bacterium]|nr:ABC transporter ATP-binding protein [Desulfocapsaceae bacterium]
MSDAPPIIELKDIHFRFPAAEHNLLEGVNFVIDKEKVGLIGTNGCGKTTLLHVVMGLVQPTSGEVFHRGKPVKTAEDLKMLRREVGFLFQSSDDQLFSPTVVEDVAFGPLNLGLSLEEARKVALKTLSNLGLEGFENRVTYKLSGGEKKLVALATILSMKPKLLLLDEPTNNLDLDTMTRLIDILNSLDLPFVIISHDWDFLAETTDHLYALEEGLVHRCEEDHIHQHRHVHPYGDRPHHHKE